MDERIRFLADVSAADWLKHQLHPFGQDTGSVVPEGFDAYCRVFHPIQPQYPNPPSLTWAELAAQNGRIAHPDMQLHMINRPVGTSPPDRYVMDNGPAWGWLPVEVRSTLVKVLTHHTSTPGDCWFCVWEGFGYLDSVPTRLVRLDSRNYALYSGPIELALAPLDSSPILNSPNLWWPDDRSWVVATEIDFAWTYVGGTSSLIGELVATDGLEAMVVHLEDRPFSDGDLINAPLDSA